MWTRWEIKGKAKKMLGENYGNCVIAALILHFFGILSNIEKIQRKLTGTTRADSSFYNTLKEMFSNNGTSANIIGILVLIVIVSILLDVYFFNPLYFGCRSFAFYNLKYRGYLSELGAGFGKNYKNIVKVLFICKLQIFLWSLVLLVPGIIKAYEYRMVPYILVENPEISWEELQKESKRLMDGNKWDSFVLDLSFIGWEILSSVTLGIAGVFFVNPYRMMTDAALYEKISELRPRQVEEMA